MSVFETVNKKPPQSSRRATGLVWADRHAKYQLLKVLSGLSPDGEDNKLHVLLWLLDVDELKEKLRLLPSDISRMEAYRTGMGPQAEIGLRKSLTEQRKELEQSIRANERRAEGLRENLSSYLKISKLANLNGRVGREFVGLVCAKLVKDGATAKGLHDAFVLGTYGTFFNALSDDRKSSIRLQYPQVVPSEPEEHSSIECGDGLRNIFLHRSHRFHRLNDDASRINQTFYYLDPHSAHNWRDIVEVGQYDQYEDCLQGIKRFVTPKTDDAWAHIWEDFVKSATFDGAVMLGGGGIEKDRMILRSILKKRNSTSPFRYAIVDISIYMLMDSISGLDEEFYDKASIIPLIWDFLELKGARAKLSQKGKNVAWFFPGGTIGNIMEVLFLKQMRETAEPGDLFILGVETWGERPLEEEKAMFQGKYNEPSIDKFIEIPLRTIWDGLKTSLRLSKAVANKNVVIVPEDPSEPNQYSGVLDSLTVEVSVEKFGAKPGRLVLLTSTRYKEERLVEAARKHGNLTHLATIPSPDNRNYKQLIFRFE